MVIQMAQNFRYRGFDVSVNKSSWSGYFEWEASGDKGTIAEREGGDLQTYGYAKEFIKRQIDAFVDRKPSFHLDNLIKQDRRSVL